ncbi:MAG: right-handed parallel beta-helix repeat-containing protein, partial [Candidatus Thorarchaeota archaeon]
MKISKIIKIVFLCGVFFISFCNIFTFDTPNDNLIEVSKARKTVNESIHPISSPRMRNSSINNEINEKKEDTINLIQTSEKYSSKMIYDQIQNFSTSTNPSKLESNVIRYSVQSLSSLTSVHDPIVISNDTDFASQAMNEGWTGNGSSIDPYIIKDYVISAAPSNGITIINTTVHFLLQNITVDSPGDTGFLFDNVTNALIINNTATNNMFGAGFSFSSSYNNTLINNVVENFNYGYGFKFSSSNNISLTNNSASNNNYGFYIDSKSNMYSFINNTANDNSQYGFFLYCSNNTLISNNA